MPVSALKSIIRKVFTSGSACTISAEAMPNFNGQRAQLARSKCTIWPGVFNLHGFLFSINLFSEKGSKSTTITFGGHLPEAKGRVLPTYLPPGYENSRFEKKLRLLFCYL